jgi:hypothetical protein
LTQHSGSLRELSKRAKFCMWCPTTRIDRGLYRVLEVARADGYSSRSAWLSVEADPLAFRPNHVIVGRDEA